MQITYSKRHSCIEFTNVESLSGISAGMWFKFNSHDSS